MKEKTQEEGKCPYCGSYDIEYEESERDGQQYNYNCHCTKCGKDFIEGYKMVFEGMFDPESGEKI